MVHTVKLRKALAISEGGPRSPASLDLSDEKYFSMLEYPMRVSLDRLAFELFIVAIAFAIFYFSVSAVVPANHRRLRIAHIFPLIKSEIQCAPSTFEKLFSGLP